MRKAGSEVSHFAPGDTVVARADPGRQGCYAEAAAVRAETAAHLPAGVDPLAAAALPSAGSTAWQALFEMLEIERGQRVLVTGGSGGVGHLAIRLALTAGASVVATSSSRNADFVRSLGADVIDYRSPRATTELGFGTVDAAFDTVGGTSTALALGAVREGGRMVCIAGHPDYAAAAARGIWAERLSARSDGRTVGRVLSAVAHGELRPEIEATYRLEDAVEAWRRSMSGRVRGKLVLSVGE